MSVQVIPYARSAAAAASRVLGTYGRWWLGEFLAMFPVPIAQWLMGGRRLSLVVKRGEEAVMLALIDGNRQAIESVSVASADYTPAVIDEFLGSRGGKEVAVGLCLRGEQVFSRKLVLPVEVTRSLDQVLAQDLSRRTPFRPDAVLHDYGMANAPATGKITVWQWIAQRQFVDDAVSALGLDAARLAFVCVDREPGCEEPVPHIALRRTDRGRRPLVRTVATALACSAVALAVLAGWLEYRRQDAIITGLDRQIAGLRARAQQVRATMEQVEAKQATVFRLRAQKVDMPGLLDIWDEATRLLPAHSWLTELRLLEAPQNGEQRVTMTGFSAAASSLVSVVDQSPLFLDVALTAPVSLDPVEQRERFSLQAKLKSQQPVKRASR